MQNHEYANLFPMMSAGEHQDLKADIQAKGLLQPIIILQGQILDGRNRYKACQELGIMPEFLEYAGNDPLGDVISWNLKRRHLDSSQKACVAVKYLPLYEAEAKKRQIEAGKEFGRGQEKVVPKIEQPYANKKSIEIAAETFGTNKQYVADAKKLASEKPDLFKKVESGEKTITQAKREIKEEKREEVRQENRAKIEASNNEKPLEALEVKFPTIVIDPPWDWGDEGDKDQLGQAKPDYHTVPFSELLKLPVNDLAMDDAHLYLWITNRSLPKGFKLMDSWGFRYITCLTWVKPSFGIGNYFRGQTEQVLFGVKGSLALRRKDVGTVFNAQRGPNGHSSKPVEFYDLVESCSHGPYLEMFSRQERTDWTSWGENGLNR